MRHLLRKAIHCLLLVPAARYLFGSSVDRAAGLNITGPAIVVANHNSHMDTAVLLAAFPTKAIPRVRPVAAADYFLRNRLLAWFATRIVGILPIERRREEPGDALAGAVQALAEGQILILFPEGTRGEPGVLGRLRTGVARLAAQHPEVPVIPVWLDGCDRAMPKGARLPRVARTRASVGEPVWIGPHEEEGSYLRRLRDALLAQRPHNRASA